MADGYDRFDKETGAGSSFVMGLLTGTVLGAGLGILFAPKRGSELRNQISERAGSLANTASEGYRKATDAAATTANDWADRGRDMYGKAREAVTRGADEAQRYVRDATSSVTGAEAPAPSGGGSSFDGGSEQKRGSQSPTGPTGSSSQSGPSSSGGSRRS